MESVCRVFSSIKITSYELKFRYIQETLTLEEKGRDIGTTISFSALTISRNTGSQGITDAAHITRLPESHETLVPPVLTTTPPRSQEIRSEYGAHDLQRAYGNLNYIANAFQNQVCG